MCTIILLHTPSVRVNTCMAKTHTFNLIRVEFRSSLSKDIMRWADVIVPIGGDGTFLLAAGRASPLFAQSQQKTPIFGFNSDPQRSEGRLMLPKHYSENPADAVAKIKSVCHHYITHLYSEVI